MLTRSDLLERLRAGAIPDLLIIGGGINGVGVFRDLAAQGVPALLVEAGDFASGTSAAPSRLIHGGLRYLETGETELVREALTERNLLLKNAAHVVRPQPVWIPLRSWHGGALSAALRFFRLKKTPGRKGVIPVALGLRAYDWFDRKHRSMPRHRIIGARQARREMPVLSPDVKAVAEYYDARISHPERLVLELIADAEGDCAEAMALPYMAAGRLKDGHVTLHDKLSGEEYRVSPKLVINASGAWVDRVHKDLTIRGRLMGGTRGTHMVMRNPQLASDLGGRMLYFETHDFRACIALPLDDSHVYVGTTDVRTDDPDDRDYTEAEIEYILDVLRPVLPSVDWRDEDSVFTMAGVRPLPFQDDKVKASGAISRDHGFKHHAPEAGRPFETITLIGGKWTTYRAFAEQVTDAILPLCGRKRRIGTDHIPIGGARDLPETQAERDRWIREIAGKTGIDVARCTVLAERYGTKASAFAQAEGRDERRFQSLEGYGPAEIELVCRTERVSRLEDVILRRTLMAFEGRTSRAAIEEVADVVAGALGWDRAERNAQVEETVTLMRERHRVSVS